MYYSYFLFTHFNIIHIIITHLQSGLFYSPRVLLTSFLHKYTYITHFLPSYECGHNHIHHKVNISPGSDALARCPRLRCPGALPPAPMPWCAVSSSDALARCPRLQCPGALSPAPMLWCAALSSDALARCLRLRYPGVLPSSLTRCRRVPPPSSSLR